ncbi:MAG: lytic transglycosylase domain-containing protein [Defluviitaleaceae bacterium]|nr:lytic transglycosylase domain-containing protein [Defluviitaleaceae bacterium]MCL2273743.1 lytic transglycosylase domain-containing protein [Defluviitaleaceae bacterium]
MTPHYPPRPRPMRRRRRRRSLALPLVLLFALILAIGVGIVGVRMRFPIQHLDIVREHAGDIDPSWIMAVIMAESSFRPQARSPVGAQGLMQLMPDTAQWLAGLAGMRDFEAQDVWQPEINIALGSFYLNWLLRHFDGDMRLALAAYNAGQGNVRNWLNNPYFAPDGQTLYVIPFTETYNYINRVEFNQRIYSILLRFHR